MIYGVTNTVGRGRDAEAVEFGGIQAGVYEIILFLALFSPKKSHRIV